MNRYIYTGVISVENNDISLVDVVIAADELDLCDIFQLIEEILLKDKSCWKMKDVIKIFQRNDFTNLYRFAIELACENPEIIFESEDFLIIEEIYLIQLLKSDHLKLDEIKIWEFMINWGIKNTDSILSNNPKKWKPTNFIDLENTIHNCIPNIRFFQMSPNDYVKVRTHFKDILPDGLDEEVIQYFSNPNSILPLPLDVLPPRVQFDSNIIKATDAALIASWIDKKRGTPYNFKDLPIKFNLIYRASRNGFEIDKFHKYCDNKGPTIVIIKVQTTNEIIGGYNPLEWRHVKDERIFGNRHFYNHPCETSKSFIFSLTNRTKPRLSRVTSKKRAIIWCRHKGPSFAQDLCIYPSTSSNNYIIGKTEQKCYEEKVIDRDGFKIEDYEVFQVIDDRFSVSQTTKRVFQTTKWALKEIFRIIKPVLYQIIKWAFIMTMAIIVGIVIIIYYYFIVLYNIIKWTFIVIMFIIVSLI
jgi:hypothetical protein